MMSKKHAGEHANKIKSTCKKWLQFCLNPRLLLCCGLAWFITNGWSYVFVSLGAYFDIAWMTVAGSTWAALLWFPFTPEKIVTIVIAIFLLRVLFPKDQKTLLVLRTEQQKIKDKMRVSKQKRKQKRRIKWLKKELSLRRKQK